MNTSRFKIATLLTAGYATVCIFLAAAIALGLNEQAKLSAITTSMAGDRWPRIELASHVRLRVTDIAVLLRNVMLTYDPTEQQQQIDDIARFRKEIAADAAELDRRVQDREGRTALARVDAAIRAYETGQRQLLALIQSRQDVEARAYLGDEVMPMLNACRDAMASQIGNEVVQMNQARQQAADAYAATRSRMLVLGALGLLCSAALAALVTGRLRRSLGGEPAQAARIAARIAAGDLTGAIALRDGDRGSMMYEMERMRVQLGELVGRVRQDTGRIAAASAEIAAGNLDLSVRTGQQAASLEETAVAMTRLSATVERNSAHADLANTLVRQAAAAAERGGDAVAAVSARMQDIVASATRVSEIVSLIDGIAFQTNILALNAAVEAARAGDAGRGFAVVAAEVRQLAQRSAAAAHQIGTLISAATEQASSGAAMVGQTGGAMRDIIDSVARVEQILVQIGTAGAEQLHGIVACSRTVADIDQGTQQNAALVEQVAATAQALQDQSDHLVRAVSRFQLETGTPAALPPPTAGLVPQLQS